MPYAPSIDPTRVFTADELLRMPERGGRCFLLRGRIIEQPYRSARGGATAARVAGALGVYLIEHPVGYAFAASGFQVGWRPDTVLAPAVSFVRSPIAKADLLSDDYFQGPPHLAFEIDCPSETAELLDTKVRELLAAGCEMVVVLDPLARQARVHRRWALSLLRADEVLDARDVVPGWTVPLRDVFTRYGEMT
jgi:Uma2 family endonuclease